MNKFAIIGGGNIGGALAYLIAARGLGDAVIIDIREEVAAGKALDISQASVALGSSSKVLGSNDYRHIIGADVIFITAGIPRSPGMSREDLLAANASILRAIASSILQYAADALIIVITNPLDIMVWLFQRLTGLGPRKVIGMAGALDVARFSYFLAQELAVAIQTVKAIIIGSHNDAMVPLLSHTTIGGVPLRQLVAVGKITEHQITRVVDRTKNAGAEIISLLHSSAYYAPAAAALDMAQSYLLNQRKVICAAVQLTGQYGLRGIYLGMPALIDSSGVAEIIELPLEDAELRAIQYSAAEIRKYTEFY